jgi:hypothetical protein
MPFLFMFRLLKKNDIIKMQYLYSIQNLIYVNWFVFVQIRELYWLFSENYDFLTTILKKKYYFSFIYKINNVIFGRWIKLDLDYW